jgi:hypothetical protein
VETPETRFTKTGDVSIAYQVIGDGDVDLVLVSGTVRDLVVGSRIVFSYHGLEALAGVPGEWRVFAVAGGDRE